MVSLVSFRHLKSTKQKSLKNKKADKTTANNFNYKDITFPLYLKKFIVRLKRKIIFALMHFVTKMT